MVKLLCRLGSVLSSRLNGIATFITYLFTTFRHIGRYSDFFDTHVWLELDNEPTKTSDGDFRCRFWKVWFEVWHRTILLKPGSIVIDVKMCSNDGFDANTGPKVTFWLCKGISITSNRMLFKCGLLTPEVSQWTTLIAAWLVSAKIWIRPTIKN